MKALPGLMRRYMQTKSEGQKKWYARFMSTAACPLCNRNRLKEEVLHVRIDGRSIIDITRMSVHESYAFFKGLKFTGNRKLIAGELLKEISNRLGFLNSVGLGYLSLERKGPTLSGGESQRIRLASQVGSELTGVLYILDEPTTGLHFADIHNLLEVLNRLVEMGNTVIVIEHNLDVIKMADHIIDLGPEGGEGGGQIVSADSPEDLAKCKKSYTGKFLKPKLEA